MPVYGRECMWSARYRSVALKRWARRAVLAHTLLSMITFLNRWYNLVNMNPAQTRRSRGYRPFGRSEMKRRNKSAQRTQSSQPIDRQQLDTAAVEAELRLRAANVDAALRKFEEAKVVKQETMQFEFSV